MVQLQLKDQEVKIDGGELTGYQQRGHEFIHQKGSPGWRSSDTEMFPLIGPTAEAGFQVEVDAGRAIQDQHGLLRELDYELISNTETTAVFRKLYTAGTLVRNSKYPAKSEVEWLEWPYDFEFIKEFTLRKDGLEVRFEISGPSGMPYMLGYHPAFKIHTEKPEIIVENKRISLEEVLAVGSRALEVPETNVVLLKDKNHLEIRTQGFKHFMLWTEVSNMVCIEPITFYPYAVPQSQLHEGFEQLLQPPAIYKVWLNPKRTDES
ncbi:aldose 1-epimerase [Flavobacteriaceae bacterium R33]|uniref:Aldose 1-epimerase n=2 Tax=Poritiphilus flavus TaxID=2697053 RepID=A0A6L9EHN7_9FLAO|nr:aldose 1-epimerase [Poritiphilus flavus]